MMTVRQDSENKLREVLNSILPQRASWRAMSFNFSLLKEHVNTKDFQKIAFGVITNELSEYEATVFFMKDEDIIVVGKGITKKDYDGIIKEIYFHVPDDVRLKIILPLSVLYDLGVSWQELYETNHDKISALNVVNESKVASIPIQPEVIAPTKQVTEASTTSVIKKNSILIVEDDPLSIFITKKALEPDFIVHIAENGDDAISAYIKYKPDVVFLDIGLPDISGHEVLRRIILDIDPMAYVIMLSANNGPADIMHALQLGSQGFISKPFSKSKLIQYISQAPNYNG